MKKQIRACLTAIAVALAAPSICLNVAVAEVGPGEVADASFSPEAFALPQEAALLVVVEGTGGSSCRVYAYEKDGEGIWQERLCTAGYLGSNGMSSHRTEGDKTTPIGIFALNTPFGQCPALPGFPSDYIQVDDSYIWTEDTNELVQDTTRSGEQVGTEGYAGFYDYVLDSGYNRNAIAGKGSALFLHCMKEGRDSTSGCVSVPKESMAVIMCLYGQYGEGACFIAQAPEGTFAYIYGTYGLYDGLSPSGEFGD